MAGSYPTPGRQPVRVARGTYCSLNSNREQLLDGEVCYAEDMRAIFVAEERNGKMQLNPIRTTVRPEPPPVLRLHGLLDVTAPGSAPAGPRNGDIVLSAVDGTADASWIGIAGTAVVAGDQLAYDAALPGWRNLGATIAAPAWFRDLTQLPALP